MSDEKPGEVTTIIRAIKKAAEEAEPLAQQAETIAASVESAGGAVGQLAGDVAAAVRRRPRLLEIVRRSSDRLITPLSLGLALIAAAVLVDGLVWLVLDRGYHADEVLGLAAKLVTGLAAFGTFVFQVTARHQASRTEAASVTAAKASIHAANALTPEAAPTTSP